jgi:spermidine synthase
MSLSVRRVAPLLFLSGACALVYQVAWFRELRLIFGASTASSAAVLAIFMSGLGVGGLFLGRRADKAKNPLGLYANLELTVALASAVTPLLVMTARAIYVGVGGTAALGGTAGTIVRLVLAALVLGPATFLMGGTLPAAARAVGTVGDRGRQRVAALYGANTAGAVVGALTANFVAIEVFGTRLTLWIACLVNALVAVIARMVSRLEPDGSTAARAEESAGASTADSSADDALPIPKWLPPAAAAIAGLSFMLMELVWYRMLAPILGGSSYTFGLILAIALLGIGIGSLAYALGNTRATVRLLAVTCALEALFVALPIALGDRLAVLALMLRPMSNLGLAPAVTAWSVVTCIVVLPAAIVSGAQFPLIIGLYGSGDRNLGRQVGLAYLANTIGGIVGSLAGGFGLIPALGAIGCWRAVAALLCLFAIGAIVVARGAPGLRRTGAVAVLATFALVLTFAARGPTAFWRHQGIGAGRADWMLAHVSPTSIESGQRASRDAVAWEQDGVESSLALVRAAGYAFVLNGKTDGHSTNDAGTQVMSGLLGALIHPAPRHALVVGLGTGSTAGWLGAVPTMEQVDVVELEPAMMRVARDCAPVNQDVLSNHKVHVAFGDARETLLTTRNRYDIVFSEPSNPYRAGISSLYTKDFYAAAAEHLEKGGIFIQWIQAYEVDTWAVATAARTLRSVFPDLSIWATENGDLLLVARAEEAPLDVDAIRQRLTEEPFATGARAVWHTRSAEGVLAHFVANGRIVDVFKDEGLGVVNTDDSNMLEFAFARGIGTTSNPQETVRHIAVAHNLHRPTSIGVVDWNKVEDERVPLVELESYPREPAAVQRPRSARILKDIFAAHRAHDTRTAKAAMDSLGRPARNPREAILFADVEMWARGPRVAQMINAVWNVSDRKILETEWLLDTGDISGAAAAMDVALKEMRTDPWGDPALLPRAIRLITTIVSVDKARGRHFVEMLAEPFAVERDRAARVTARLRLARFVHDDALCVDALSAFEPNVPWDRFVLETRAACYAKTGDPRASDAANDFARFVVTQGDVEADDEAEKAAASPPTQHAPAENEPPAALDAAAPAVDASTAPAATGRSPADAAAD